MTFPRLIAVLRPVTWRLEVTIVLAVVMVGWLMCWTAQGQNIPPGQPRNVSPVLIRLPDLQAQEEMREAQANQKKNFGAVNALRKKDLSDDSVKLLQMAGELRDELDKASADTLSLAALRKAEAIEKLVRSMKQKIKTTPGIN